MKKILILNDIHHGETRASTTHPGEVRQANSQALTTLSGYIDIFNSRNYDCVINLGDAIRDTNSKTNDIVLLDECIKVFSKINGNKFFIPGNHELKTLSDEEIFNVTNKYKVSSVTPQIFELGSFQIILINSVINEQSLGSIPEKTIAWAKKNIDNTKKTIVFSHYSLLDLDGYANFYFDQEHRYMTYTNGDKLLNLLSKTSKVLSINAHTHMGSYKKLSNIDAISALAFSENIGAMQYPDANPGVYSEIWVDRNSVYFKSYSGKYCFLSMEL